MPSGDDGPAKRVRRALTAAADPARAFDGSPEIGARIVPRPGKLAGLPQADHLRLVFRACLADCHSHSIVPGGLLV
jgi:hypothetical protein